MMRAMLVMGAAFAVAACPASSAAPAAPVPAKVGAPLARPLELTLDDDGLPMVLLDGAVIVRGRWAFWGQQWAWANVELRAGNMLADGGFATIDVPLLGLHVEQAATLTAQGASVVLDVSAARDVAAVVGGGIELALVGDGAALGGVFLDLDPSEKDSVRVRTAGGDVVIRCQGFVSVAKDPSGTVRAFLAKEQVVAGKRAASIALALPAPGKLITPRRALFDEVKRKQWHENTLAPDEAPIDLSFLNHKPAGARGRVRVDGEALVFADGTPVRFWGTNLQAFALFTGSDDEIRAQAKRLAAWGFNLVRIHHHDSPWTTNVIDASTGTSQKLDDKNLERLDFWIKCLKDEGIYLWIDLHVGRRFVAGDGIPGFDELQRNHGGEARGFSFLNDKIAALMDSFARAYLTRKNRYTNTALIDDPAVAAVLVTNENDLVQHFGNLFLADKGNPHHHQLWLKQLRAFAKASGLNEDRLGETWLPGPAKLLLADLEKRFFDARKQALRDLGYQGIVAPGSTWGEMDAVGLLSLSTGDVVDVHSYGVVDELRKQPRVEADYLSWVAAAQVTGKPLTISEWNVPDVDDRFTAPLRMAAVASLQGWDAPMLYGWMQAPVGGVSTLSAWSSTLDPAIASLMPAAAVLFRQEHVAAGQQRTHLAPSAAELVDRSLSPLTSVALRSLTDTQRFSIDLPAIAALPWLTTSTAPASRAPTDGPVVTDMQLNAGAAKASAALRRDVEAGVFIVDSERSVVFSGFVGGKTLDTTVARAAIDTKAATVSLTSLDGAPLSSSKRILVSWCARARGKGEHKDQQPAYAEPVRGSVWLSTKQPLVLVPLDPRGQQLPPLTPVREGARLRVTLPSELPTHWALLVPPSAPLRPKE